MKKTVWITGASSGIGEAIAKLMAPQNTNLILSSRRQEELERVKTLCVSKGAEPDSVLVLPMDVTDESVMPELVKQAEEAFGGIDLLINNAGISQRSLCQNTDMAVYRKLFDIDVFGQMAVTKLVLPGMLARGSGHVAVTSSVAGKIGVAQRTGYCAAKHAMMGFFDALRAEVEHQGISVSTITPGWIRTAVSENAISGDGTNYGKMDKDIANGLDVDKAAAVIVEGLNKKKREVAVGGRLEMMALRLKRFAPGVVFNMMSKRGAAVSQSTQS